MKNNIPTTAITDAHFVGRTLWFTPTEEFKLFIKYNKLPYIPKRKRILRKWIKKYTSKCIMEAITEGIKSYGSTNNQV